MKRKPKEIIFKYTLGEEYVEEIEAKCDGEPKDKRTKAHKEWKNEINKSKHHQTKIF
jgi:hypothetical protein